MLAEGGDAAVLLGPMEQVLSTLDAVQPNRLAGKRKHFRNDSDKANALNLRLELLLAYRLATAQIPFEFGGKAQADIRCETQPGQLVWLEVTSRAKDDQRALNDELEEALDGLDVHVTLWTQERRLKICQDDRGAVCERIKALVHGPAPSVFTMPLPEIDGEVTVTRAAPVGPSRVTWDAGGALTEHLGSVEQELRNVIELKKEQAGRDGFAPTTLLAIDGARLGLSSVPPASTWDGPGKLGLDWDDIPFVGLL